MAPSPSALPPTDARATGGSTGLPLAVWLTALLFVLLLLPKIGSGTLWHHDELLTANRAREMLVRGDPLAVTLNFAPSLQKPPLQFWVCALLLKLLPAHPEFAVRLPTLLAGAGCVLAAAWLARAYLPAGNAGLATWAALALAGCGYLVHASRIALLDPGAALFLTLALVGCRLAQRNARWWWFVALQCVLGAWQKAPYGLAAWVLVLATERWLGRDRRQLGAALALAFAGSLGWWFIDWARADHALLLAAGYAQTTMFLRPHDPTDPGLRPWLYWVWLARDWALPGICAPVAACVAVLARRRGHALAGPGLVCVVFGGVIACLVYRSERYLVVITPALAVLTVHGLSCLAARLPRAARPWLLPVVLATALPAAGFQYLKPSPSRPDLLAVARELGRTWQPGERIFVNTDADPTFDTPEFVLFYASLRRPLEKVVLPDIEALPANAGPCRGICGQAQWGRLARTQPSIKQVFAVGNWILWARQT